MNAERRKRLNQVAFEWSLRAFIVAAITGVIWATSGEVVQVLAGVLGGLLITIGIHDVVEAIKRDPEPTQDTFTRTVPNGWGSADLGQSTGPVIKAADVDGIAGERITENHLSRLRDIERGGEGTRPGKYDD